FLPLDEMRQHLLGGFAIADEIVVDKVECRRRVRLRENEIQFGNDLPRRLHPRLAAVETGDVAELAEIRTAGRELYRAEQIAAERHHVIGRQWELGERQAVLGRGDDLACRTRGAL